MYCDMDGAPISLRTWCVLHETSGEIPPGEPGTRFLAQEDVDLPGGGRAFVSTVWVGINMATISFRGEPVVPLVFETMIFWESGDYGSEDYCVRTPTRQAALAEHDQAVTWARNLGQKLPEGYRIKEQP